MKDLNQSFSNFFSSKKETPKEESPFNGGIDLDFEETTGY